MKTLNDPVLADALASIPQLPQLDCSCNDQLQYLYHFANKLGLYDAADLMHQVLLRRRVQVDL